MKFTKMEGCGNDYVYVNGLVEQIPYDEKPELVRTMSDRHFGVGSDGVIFINGSDQADFEMEMWNADGTRSEMCGNGIRCVAKYVYDMGLTKETSIRIISGGSVKYLDLTVEDGQVSRVRVNMGAPILAPAQIPVDLSHADASDLQVPEEGPVIGVPITAAGRKYSVTCVSMGNPHAVTFVDDVHALDLPAIGPSCENHPLFPKRVNTEFVHVVSRNFVEMRVWERGTGETLACGTGACATAVACMLNGLTDNLVTVKLLGGELLIEWDREANLVYMTGPARIVFHGEWN